MQNKEQLKSGNDILEKIRKILPDLPGRMRQCGEFIVSHHDQIAFSTVAEISTMANVQPSAMMRFCSQLGLSGYSEMQKIFRKEVSKAAPDYATRLSNLQAKGDLSASKLLAEFVEAGRFSLEKMTSEINIKNLDHAVDLLARTEMIHIVGYRRAFPIASCLSYTLEKLHVPNICHDDVGKVSKYSAIRDGDVVIAATFAPYTAGTIEFVEKALEKGATVIALTDTEISPVNMDGVILLKVVDVDVGDFRSLSASINLAMALAVSVGNAREQI